ncbi:MAG: tryptophan synthase subunit alpha [Aggregatilineales bacterium]
MIETAQHGVTAIAATFARAKTEGRATFMPYWMIGYPDMPTSIQIVNALIDVGADAIELGVPFSDPLADGVVIQAAAQAALDKGTTLTDCVHAVQAIRIGAPHTPLLLMSYINPMLTYGLDRYATDTATAGADGFIVPDLPPEEAGTVLAHCSTHNLALIELLAPTSSPDRIKLVAETAKGFIYLVALTGVTGARDALSPELPGFIARVRAATDLPLVVGFGISRPEHVRQIKQVADGIIVASALIRAQSTTGIDSALALARELRGAC